MDSPPPSKRYKVRNHLTTNNDRELHKKQTWNQGNGNKAFDLDMKCISRYVVRYCTKGDTWKKKPLPK